MKVFALILLCATAYLSNAATTPQPVDYREMYDHLLMEVINERIREGERFLEHLSQQLKEYQTSHKEEVRQHIVHELEFILPMVTGVEHHFETELKKTGLDMLERFTIEKARDEAQLVIKALTEVQKQVQAPKGTTKAPVFFAATASPVDYRSEYDRLLFQTIEERIQRGDGMLLFLNRQLQEYQKTKSAEVKEHIVREVEGILPLLKMAEDHATNELKRTDLNHLERFLYEKAQDEVKLLIKHYTQIEAAVNAKPSLFEFFAATTVAPVDWRSEYDRLLFQLTEEHVRRADDLLIRLQRQVNEYKQTKDKEIAASVAREVDFTLPLIKNAQEYAQRELKRTDLNHVERYLFEKVNDEVTILIKHYTAMEKEVKGVAFFEAEIFLAPANRSAEVRAVEVKFLEISHEVREYLVHKTDEAKTKIVSEIDAELAKIKDLLTSLEADLAETHGILERFHVEREVHLLRNTQNAYRREEERVKGSVF